MNLKITWQSWVVTLGLLAVVVATLLPLLRVQGDTFRYVYAAGALAMLIGRFASRPPQGVSLRLRRMLRMETWTAVIFAVGAVFVWLPQSGSRDWIAFTLAGGILLVYTSVMIPRLAKKEGGQDSQDQK